MLIHLLKYEVNEPEQTGEKPPFHQYEKWLLEHGVDISTMSTERYERIANIVKKDFTVFFFAPLIKNYCKYNNEFREFSGGYDLWEQYKHKDYCIRLNAMEENDKKKYKLLRNEIFTKTFSSFLLKTYRKNILENENWDKPPKEGWILPNNWFSKINDIVRTRFIVKYLDGVEFLMNKIEKLADELGMKSESSFEANERGYYAAHIHLKKKYEVPNVFWEFAEVEIPVEIQIKTQLQALVEDLSHTFYEKRRKEIKRENSKWQWQYNSKEFETYYLGHILHYADSKIVEVRKNKKEDL
jgi:ppGpp synthetase/RelA/SpoT-type nucleotidyltranferase